MQSYITKIKCKNETEILYTIYKSNYIVHIYSFTTHFFLLKMQLKTRHAIEKTMPAKARIEKVAVRGIATVTSCSNGIPSYGMLPPGRQVRREMSVNLDLEKECQWEGHFCQMLILSHLPKKLN